MSVTEERRRAVAALAATWQVGIDGDRADQLLRYCDLLLTWSARINLTAAPSVEALLEVHLPDAFALASRLADAAAVVDVGSGGGLPAIPLAVLRPLLTVELCEPIAKKGAFLRTAIRELGLEGRVRVTAGRGEQIAAARPASFDVAISRGHFCAAGLADSRAVSGPPGGASVRVGGGGRPDRRAGSPAVPGWSTCPRPDRFT